MTKRIAATIPAKPEQKLRYVIGDAVVAMREILDPIRDDDGEELVHASPGDLGYVLELNAGHHPTICWEDTVCDAQPDVEILLVRSFDMTFRKPAIA